MIVFLHWLDRLAAVDSASSLVFAFQILLSCLVSILDSTLHVIQLSSINHLCCACFVWRVGIKSTWLAALRHKCDQTVVLCVWISSSIKTTHLHQTSVVLSFAVSPFSVAEPSNYTISFCDFPRHFALTKGDFICLFCLPSAFCLTIVGFSEFRFRAVLAKSVMASDPTSSSLNISGSSQSVLGGAVAVRSRSASSGHTSQNSIFGRGIEKDSKS